MQVENVNSLCTQLFQRCGEVLPQRLWLVDACLVWVHLGCQSEASVFPLRITCPGLLFATDIHASRVNLVIAFGLEVIQVLCEVFEVRNAGAG
jgi:hypothetical protein